MPPEERGGRRAARFNAGRVIAAAAVAAILITAVAFAAAALAPVEEPEAVGPAAGRAITSFRSEVLVERDGDVRVTERITYDFGGDGSPVVRRLPHTASIDGAPEQDLGLRRVGVSDDGGVRPVETTEEDGRTVIRIGGPDAPLTGTRSFTIEYVYGNLLVQDSQGRPRLFFNAVGTEWSVPVSGVTVDVSLPGEPEEAACYAGPQGSRSPCDSAEHGDGDGALFSQWRVAPGQAMSVDVSLAPGDLDAEIPGPGEEDGGTDSTMGVLLAFAWGVFILTVLGIVFGAGGAVVGGGGSYGGSYGGGGDGGDGGAGDGGGGGGGD
ncbi:DUF2207 domain-containing protein [Nocardiopsis potens]|uniref:DUF2207 domain-containing protein n=1 Tax=Nocardiopsis potens TaxID=1246458 RepID=UPI000476B658|nr:DUF2207 domain-containing protein [Nocardiopsis potens]